MRTWAGVDRPVIAIIRIYVYTNEVALASLRPVTPSPPLARVELYRLLSDPERLQILALCEAEELSIGELSALLEDSQPQVSRKVGPLREGHLLEARRDGTRTWLKTVTGRSADPVLADALAEGQRLCLADGSLSRIPAVVAAREETGRALFEDPATGGATAAELPPTVHLAHLAALAPLLPGRALAVDVGTGEGALLEVLAPLYDRVIAVDRSRARLARCAQRIAERGFHHVSLFPGSYDDSALVERVDAAGGADLVFAARTLHHASRPLLALQAFARLLRRGGHLVVLDYLPHPDEGLRESQGDVWLGFEPKALSAQIASAGLQSVGEVSLPPAFHREGFDSHLSWHAWVARRPLSPPTNEPIDE